MLQMVLFQQIGRKRLTRVITNAKDLTPVANRGLPLKLQIWEKWQVK